MSPGYVPIGAGRSLESEILVNSMMPALSLILGLVSLSGCERRADATARQPASARMAAGTIVSVGTMSSARASHTATLLPTGQILLAGGMTGEENAAAEAELYDPASGAFRPAGPMRTPRHSHAATRLPDGTVLITGGYDATGGYLRSAEIYDPGTNTFRSAQPMTSTRAGHVAVLLQDGRVLIAGGVGDGWVFLNSAEIYDPATASFVRTGSMRISRESHAAVALPDGHVLVVGGHQGRRSAIEIFTSAEQFDPATGQFEPAGDMNVRRHKHDAILLPDGRVLITGGTDERDSRGVYASAEIYDPVTARFRTGSAMLLPRYKHRGTPVLLPDGRVLLPGGSTRAEVYDPGTGRFAMVAGDARVAGQFSASAPLADGRVLITGGYGEGRGPQAEAWLYRP